MRHLLIGLVATVFGCGSESTRETPEPTHVPRLLSVTVEPGLSATGELIKPHLEVSVHDANGRLVSEATNAIAVALDHGPQAAALSGTLRVEAVNGVATFSDLGLNTPGSYTLKATAAGLTSATTATFEVASRGIAAAMAGLTPGLRGMVGEVVSPSPSVKVTDRFGDPVAGVSVQFRVTAGGGSVSGPNQTTDNTGTATIDAWRLGTVSGPINNDLVAESPSLTGRIVFAATALSGPAALLELFEGDGFQARPGQPVPVPPAVRVTDTYGNGISGVGVTFRITSGGGQIVGPTQVTDVDGVARLASWTLGPPGPYTLTATAPALAGSPITFHATSATNAFTVLVRSNHFHSAQNGTGNDQPLLGAAYDTLPVGGSMTWIWEGSVHNVTALPNAPPLPFQTSGSHAQPYTFGPITFNRAGVFEYRCTVHTFYNYYLGWVGMRGRIVVR